MRNIIRLTNDFILKNGIHSLPLGIEELGKICESLGYKLFSYSESWEIIRALGVESLTAYGAFTHQSSTAKIVFFKEQLSTGARNFVIAHEIGHIVLRHNYVGSIGFTGADSAQEKEANTFALQLLAPLCILNALDVRNVREIQSETLLDRGRAKKVQKLLRTYQEQPRAEEMIIAYGVRRVKHVDSWWLYIFMLLIIAVSSIGLITQRNTINTLQAQLAEQEYLLKLRVGLQQGSEPVSEIFSMQLASPSATVYITNDGKRYHKQNCYHIKNSTVEAVPRIDAESDGYSPCKDCY